MSLEQAIAELTAAVKENTAVHRDFAEIAKQASGKKAPAKAAAKAEEPAEQEAPAEEKAEEKKPAAKPAAKKPAAEKPAAKKEAAEPEISGDVSWDDLKGVCKAFMRGDDEETRELAKKRMRAAFDHLGIDGLPEIEDKDEERARLAAYVAYWNAGQKVVFERVDEAVAELADAGDGDTDEGEDDDGLGL